MGREATEAELASELGMSLRRLVELRETVFHTTSLDSPLGDEQSGTLAEVVADENAVDPARHTDESDCLAKILDLVGCLPEREAKIIRSRFGLDDGPELTFETIGAKFGVTRERIRQVQNIALGKLRRMLEQTGSRPMAA
jgi:RNA polymerase primary sigma factor